MHLGWSVATDRLFYGVNACAYASNAVQNDDDDEAVQVIIARKADRADVEGHFDESEDAPADISDVIVVGGEYRSLV